LKASARRGLPRVRLLKQSTRPQIHTGTHRHRQRQRQRQRKRDRDIERGTYMYVCIYIEGILVICIIKTTTKRGRKVK